MNPTVTILIPNYKTPEITKICIRLIRKNTDCSRIRLIVIDNNSCDSSVEYLRSLEWIDLVERKPIQGENHSQAHSRALDLGLKLTDTPYVLSLHTDTMTIHRGWLDFLLQTIESDENIAGVGSWKLEKKTFYKRFFKSIETRFESVYWGIIGKDRSRLEETPYHKKYLRSHCALYRTGLLRKYGLSFEERNMTTGKFVHESLLKNGHEIKFISAEILSQYMRHLNHATMVLNSLLFRGPVYNRKGVNKIRKMLLEIHADEILRNDALDR